MMKAIRLFGISLLASVVLTVPGVADHASLFRPDPGVDPCQIIRLIESDPDLGNFNVRRILQQALDQAVGGEEYGGSSSTSGTIIFVPYFIKVELYIRDLRLVEFDCDNNRHKIGFDWRYRLYISLGPIWVDVNLYGTADVAFSPQLDMSGSTQYAKALNLYVTSLSINNLPALCDRISICYNWVHSVAKNLANNWLANEVIDFPVRHLLNSYGYGGYGGMAVFDKLGSSLAMPRPDKSSMSSLGQSVALSADSRLGSYCFSQWRITQQGQWTNPYRDITVTLYEPITIAVAEYYSC